MPPLLQPDAHCFHCGAAIAADAASCSTCSGARALDERTERGHIAYLLGALSMAVRASVIAAPLAERVAAPFRKHGGFPAPAAPPAPRVATPPRVPPRPVNFALMWANGLLYLGAFFLIITALLFLMALGGLGRTLLASIVVVAFFTINIIYH